MGYVTHSIGKTFHALGAKLGAGLPEFGVVAGFLGVWGVWWGGFVCGRWGV